MVARLKRNVECRAPSRFPRIRQRIYFGMGTSEHLVKTLPDNGPVLYYNRSDKRIGARISGSAQSKANGPFHVETVHFIFRHQSCPQQKEFKIKTGAA
jgi:hypothetical protein